MEKIQKLLLTLTAMTIFCISSVILAADSYTFTITNPDNPTSDYNGDFKVIEYTNIQNCPTVIPLNQTITLTVPASQSANPLIAQITLQSKTKSSENSSTGSITDCANEITLFVSSSADFNILTSKVEPALNKVSQQPTIIPFGSSSCKTHTRD